MLSHRALSGNTYNYWVLNSFWKKQKQVQKKSKTLLFSSPPLDAKMDIITSKQDVLVGEEILLLCKGESY